MKELIKFASVSYSEEIKLIFVQYLRSVIYEGKVIGNISVVDMDERCFECHLGSQIDFPYWNKGI